MSEEILKALIQLFAIVAKQEQSDFSSERNYVKNFIHRQVQERDVEAYIELFDSKLKEGKPKKQSKLTSVKDSVRILKICKKINKRLEYKQKIIVVISLLEMIKTTSSMAEQKLIILDTVADVFNIPKDEYQEIKYLVLQENTEEVKSFKNFLFISSTNDIPKESKLIKNDLINGKIVILKISSANLYILNYLGDTELFMNGLPIEKDSSKVFPAGGALKLPSGRPVYFSDINRIFIDADEYHKIRYQAKNLHYKFANKKVGIQDFSISVEQNSLIGIMGVSGSGKSTLLNMMSGINKPTSGNISINGYDLNLESEKLEGIIGFIPQDDLLIESLSVYENLYYNAKLSFRNKTNEELEKLTLEVLKQLNLFEIKDLKVGSPLNKLISGGQRKRLNIALELIRKPSILFVDEPTSGLSSKDSENVMNLLRELSLQGKLIFVVIHQPSSDIYKMFDNILMMDEDGYDISYGNPVDTITYFKKHDGQAAYQRAECPSCGNVNPEQLFNIIESEVVDEYGKYSGIRKKSPQKWGEIYKKYTADFNFYSEKLHLPEAIKIPGKIKQIFVYLQRDLKSKLSDKQYLLIALLEAPVLAFMLSYLIRYIPQGNEYIFRANENLPQYIFMIVIVALFLGMTISAEEIFKDRKMLKRESFHNLSKTSYLLSKVGILMIISAIQSLLFVLIGNFVLQIEGMGIYYFLMFFSTAVFANMLGLNISATFNNIVTIYIFIPLLLIPQMILGGAMFSFDKLNKSLVRIDKVPVIAELMASKWAYEGLCVYQFKNNPFEKNFYELERKKSQASFYQVYYIPELKEYYKKVKKQLKSEGTDVKPDFVELLNNEALAMNRKHDSIIFYKFDTANAESSLLNYKSSLDYLENYYNELFKKYNNKYRQKLDYILANNPDDYKYLRNKYHNESLEDLVKKTFEKHKIIKYKNRLVQHTYPIFQYPNTNNSLDIRTHLFAPKKYFLGEFFETIYFNISIIWLMSILLFFSLRFDIFKRLINLRLGTITKFIKQR